MNLEVRIERLLLDGLAVAAGDRPALQAAVEAELTRLLAARGLAPELLAGDGLRRAPAGTVALDDGPAPEQLGARIGEAIHGAIGP